jgi:hypothetical protein
MEYELRVPNISVPSELISSWFDDVYLPDSKSFGLCFSSRELEAMRAFDNYLADQEKLLPEPRDGIKSWLDDGRWREIMREAGKALAVLES